MSAIKHINVIPEDDIIKHDESVNCKCNPVVTIMNGIQCISHNAFDKREKLEDDNIPTGKFWNTIVQFEVEDYFDYDYNLN